MTRRRERASALLLSASLALASACGPDEIGDEVCGANESRGCTCEDGAEGTQACNIYSSGWGRCLCSGGDAAGFDAGAADSALAPDSSGVDAGPGLDTSAPDLTMPDTAPTFDATLPSEPTLRAISLPAQSRGPIPIRVEVHTPWPVELALTFDRGSGASPVTLYLAASDLPTPAPVDGVIQATLVWDSFADIPDDATVTLQLTASTDGGSAPLGGPQSIELHNDPDGTRLVLAPHPSAMLDGGGSTNINTAVSLLTIDPTGVGADTGRDVQVGTGPAWAAFTGNAALALVHNDGEGTISFLDVEGTNVSVRPTPLSFAPDWIYGLALAPDARALFVLAGSSGLTSVLELELIDGVPVEQRSVELDSVAQCVAVSPRGDFVAVSRNDPNADRLLEIFDRRTLGLLGSLPYVSTLCDTLRFSADGLWLATSDSMFGAVLTLFDVSDPAVPSVADTATTLEPIDVAFHSAGGAMLVSSLTDNAVVPFTISSTGALSAGTWVTGGIPLAAEMDILRRGTRDSLVAVSALSSVVLVQLNADGSATKTGTVDLGEGIENSVQGMAVAP